MESIDQYGNSICNRDSIDSDTVSSDGHPSSVHSCATLNRSPNSDQRQQETDQLDGEQQHHHHHQASEAENQEQEDDQNKCPLCDSLVEVFAVGKCPHMICYVCSTKMRVICNQSYCPICRTDLDIVHFTRDRHCIRNVKETRNQHGIVFTEPALQQLFQTLLENRCKICDALFRDFDQLTAHVSDAHRRSYCNICCNTLKLFPSERESYTREGFAKHMMGTSGDRGAFVVGHPMCVFCKKRFFDKDDLYRHSTVDHFYCSFCNGDGIITFYREYEELRGHFRAKHFLCEEGDCKHLELRSNVFETEVELKIHQLETHTRRNRNEARRAGAMQISDPADDDSVYIRTLSDQTAVPVPEITDENFPTMDTSYQHAALKVSNTESMQRGLDTRLPPVSANFQQSSTSTSKPRADIGVQGTGRGWGREQEPTADTHNVRPSRQNASPSGWGYAGVAAPVRKFDLYESEFPSLPGASASPVPLKPQKMKWGADMKSNRQITCRNRNPRPRDAKTTGNANTQDVNRADKNIRNPVAVPSMASKFIFPPLDQKSPTIGQQKPRAASSRTKWSLESIGESLWQSGEDRPTNASSSKSGPATATSSTSKEWNENVSDFPALCLAPELKSTGQNFAAVVGRAAKVGSDIKYNDMHSARPVSRRKGEQKPDLQKPERTIETTQYTSDYVPPLDFENRKAVMACKILDSVNENAILFNKFKETYSSFVGDKKSALDFYNKSIDIVGLNGLYGFIFELIAIVPNIAKQHQLYNVVQSSMSSLPKKLRVRHLTYNWRFGSVVACDVCQQLMAQQDLISHKAISHD